MYNDPYAQQQQYGAYGAPAAAYGAPPANYPPMQFPPPDPYAQQAQYGAYGAPPANYPPLGAYAQQAYPPQNYGPPPTDYPPMNPQCAPAAALAAR